MTSISPLATIHTSAYDLATLQTWTQRPTAVAKCFVRDVYELRALIPAHVNAGDYLGRDVYLLNQWPCRMVELVAWVAGAENKDKTLLITADDGDGQHVLQVTVYLPLHVPAVPAVEGITSRAGETFLSAKERKEQRKIAAEAASAKKAEEKFYLRKDVVVGDTVRIVGRVNEFPRRRAGGVLEWFREVVVDEGSGGSLVVVDEEEQYDHIDTVRALHKTVYSQPFHIPSLANALIGIPATTKQYDATFSTLSSPPQTLSDLPSSDWSEVDIPQGRLQLRDPAKLRPSQLTDSIYRQYVLDYMTQETVRVLEASSSALGVFPEYAEYLGDLEHGTKRSTRSQRRSAPNRIVVSDAEELHPFTLTDILDVPHLHQLATLVVDAVARKEEKRRRRRIIEGVPRAGDLEIDTERKRTGRDWRLTAQERSSRMARLTSYIIRGLAADGAIVHLQDGYLPLPPILVFPLLAPHFEREAFLRKGVYMRKTDSRYGNGATAAELVVRLKGWGADGRWERMNEWVVQDAIGWAEGKGLVKKQGTGWWLMEADA